SSKYDKCRLLAGPRRFPARKALQACGASYMARFLMSITAAFVALSAATCLGQDAMLEELYGRGVHAFFAGNIRGSFDSLNAAIQSGSRDPRAFYYRGLV